MVAETGRLCARTNIDIDYWDREQSAVPISLSPLTVLLQALAEYMELIVFSLNRIGWRRPHERTPSDYLLGQAR
jgi:hypothetical protein